MDLGQLVDRVYAHELRAAKAACPPSSPDLQRVAALASTASAQPVTPAYVAERTGLYAAWWAHVERLRLMPQPAQRSEEWHRMRNGMVTASDFAQALGHGKFGSQREFIMKKVDNPPFNACMPPLLWGVKYEPVAAAIYERRHSVALHEFGLLPHPTNTMLGASPDGITDLGVMLEIKCPWRRKIVEGAVPEQYAWQIQVQLDVCGLDECDYQECKLREYDDLEEWLEDGGWGMLAADGNEKGVVMTAPGNPPVNFYPEPVLQDWTAEGLEAWARSVKADHPGAELSYYRLDQMQVIRVHRDPEFMATWVPALEEVWQRVLDYRADRELYAREVLQTKKAPKCLLLSDDEAPEKEKMPSARGQRPGR